MNPDDLAAQQQAYLNQVMQSAQQWQIVYLVIAFATAVIGPWVIYMFYARLRDIADELRNIRVTYEMEQDRAARVAAKSSSAPTGDKPGAGDSPYMPKG
jgi:hypothetical protein